MMPHAMIHVSDCINITSERASEHSYRLFELIFINAYIESCDAYYTKHLDKLSAYTYVPISLWHLPIVIEQFHDLNLLVMTFP